MKLVIDGKIPSKKNGKRIVTFGGKPRIISSASYIDWEEAAALSLANQFRGYVITDYPVELTILVFYGDDRRHDLDNSAAGVLDALVKAGIIVDDNVKYINCLAINYGGIDRINPRVEIYIDE